MARLLIRSAESAAYMIEAQVLANIFSKDKSISRFQRSVRLGLAHPARWAGLLHLTPSAQLTTYPISMVVTSQRERGKELPIVRSILPVIESAQSWNA